MVAGLGRGYCVLIGVRAGASSLLMMTPIGGCFFLLMGYVADQTNLVVPFLIPFIGYFIVLLYASELSRKS